MAESANEPNQPKDEDRLEFLTAEESAWEAPPPSEPGDADPEQEVLDADFRRHRTPFESIVRGHLFVHAALIQYVEAALERQGALDLARMDFYLVVRLAVALGLIDPDDVGGLGQLNALRNRFAHNIRAEISLQDGIDLYNALGPNFRRRTGLSALKPFRDEHLSELVYRSIKVLHDRLIKDREYLLAIEREAADVVGEEDNVDAHLPRQQSVSRRAQ